MKFNEQLENLLKTLNKFIDQEGVLLKQNIKDSAEKFDTDLIKLLLNDKASNEHFFDKIDNATIFNYRKFIDYIDDKNFLIDSYTKFSNKVGLTISNKHIKQIDDVVLSFPFKDCVLEGGQSKDDEKRKEIFFNEVLAKDEINRLLDKKVICNAQKYRQNGLTEEVKFTRDAQGTIKDNLIIKGNNLLALHTLKSNFAGKVKLIYIDPPYNTGNDSFNYNDNFNHSTWLTFMKNRLEVARDLLADDGVIFVQCDDNEQAYLKVLMDEVFGRDNFLNTLSIKTKVSSGASGGGEDKKIKKNIEFMHCYFKNTFLMFNHVHKETEIDTYIQLMKLSNKSFKYTQVLISTGNKEHFKTIKDGSGKDIKIYKHSGIVAKTINEVKKEENLNVKQVYKKYFNNIFTTTNPQSSIRQRVWDAVGNENFFYSIEYTPKSGKNKHELITQYYLGKQTVLLIWLRDTAILDKSGNVIKKEKYGTFWDGFDFINVNKEGLVAFSSGKKPESILERVIEISTKKGDLVLDYHLGSGTTCAVAHKMGRQYIGIEQMDYIEDIAVKRMQKVIGKPVKKDGELLESVEFDNGGISKNVDWQGGGEFVYFEMDKYNQKYMDELSNATDKTILKLYDEIIEKAFLNYDVESEKLAQEKNAFKTLSLSEQQEFLISILNKNQLYKNLSEMNDKDLAVDDKTKALNNDFYGK